VQGRKERRGRGMEECEVRGRGGEVSGKEMEGGGEVGGRGKKRGKGKGGKN